MEHAQQAKNPTRKMAQNIIDNHAQ